MSIVDDDDDGGFFVAGDFLIGIKETDPNVFIRSVTDLLICCCFAGTFLLLDVFGMVVIGFNTGIVASCGSCLIRFGAICG